MAGAGALFTREDAAEAAWAAVDPVLEKQHEVRRYYRRSWGPKKADAIIAATAVGIILSQRSIRSMMFFLPV
jgi:glucose-6-phosphate 1-dehydrogenase